MKQKKLFLLDAFALIYRSYYAFIRNPRINSKGLNTSAIFGFTNTLLEVIKNEQPSHIGVVFDPPSPLLRTQEFEAYKANREETPEDIRSSIPYIQEIVKAMNIPILMVDGYEADDVIGTLAKKAVKEGFITYMMTPDKDYGQLVEEDILIYKPSMSGSKAEILGVAEVCQKFEVSSPEQVIDILGLWGDAVDNIPGIPGIGEKTAKKLIQEFGSLEQLIAHSNELKGKLRENVENFAGQGILSKKLATIITDVPIAFDEAALKICPPNQEALHEVFMQLEFRTLIQRTGNLNVTETTAGKPKAGQLSLFSDDTNEADAPTPMEEVPSENPLNTHETYDKTTKNYKVITSEKGIKEMLETINKNGVFCFDTETTGLEVLTAELVGIAFSVAPHQGWYLPFPENRKEAETLLAQLEPLWINAELTVVAHNLKYDMQILKGYGVTLKGKLFDTMIAHYLLNPDMRHGMDVLAENYLHYKTITIETLIGEKGKDQLNMRNIPIETISNYACEDADVTFQLYLIFKDMLEKEGLSKLFTDMEMPLVPVLAAMEIEGVKLDVKVLRELSDSLEEDLGILEDKIIAAAGTSFNIDSPKQLGDILFDKLNIEPKPKRTKTGQYATGEDVLIRLAPKYEVVADILEYRSLRKLKNTYVDTLPELISPISGRLHTSYLQTVAATGRLSSSQPNLQNIPIKTEKGRKIRAAFIPRDDKHVLLAADYSQVELRIMASLSGDENMIQTFKDDGDIHTATAARIHHVPLERVDKSMRNHAKSANFGIIYGISAFGLAQNLNISRGEAANLIKSYFEQYPGVKTYMEKSIQNAKDQGYVETWFGRKRYLRDILSANAVVRGHAERNAINAPLQGTAADIIKVAMIRIDAAIKQAGLQSKMILQIHDELVFDVLLEEVDAVRAIVGREMMGAASLRVPLKVDMNIGQTWLEAH